jgi:uroporphyrinogen-III synthase
MATYQLVLRGGVLLLRLSKILLVLVVVGLLGLDHLGLVLGCLCGRGGCDVGHVAMKGRAEVTGRFRDRGGLRLTVGTGESGRSTAAEDKYYISRSRVRWEIRGSPNEPRKLPELLARQGYTRPSPAQCKHLCPDIPCESTMAEQSRGRVPILLLKTKSTPSDTYEELFTTWDNHRCAPFFVPVLEHRFKRDALDHVRRHVTSHGFAPHAKQGSPTYGALVFTSQRAVEAFTHIVEEVRSDGAHAVDDLLPATLPLYVVGPATARGLRALNLPCPILGEHTGNGEALAAYMLEHYGNTYPGTSKPPILFLVGDKRRDIIPKTMQAAGLGEDRRCKIDELVIYETGEMQSFKDNFSTLWRRNSDAGHDRQWIVVFSPTGCQAMLESLGFLDPATGRARPGRDRTDILIATIGPTTRDYLLDEFGFSPDVCAEKPSPEGIAEGIQTFEQLGISV